MKQPFKPFCLICATRHLYCEPHDPVRMQEIEDMLKRINPMHDDPRYAYDKPKDN